MSVPGHDWADAGVFGEMKAGLSGDGQLAPMCAQIQGLSGPWAACPPGLKAARRYCRKSLPGNGNAVPGNRLVALGELDETGPH